MIVSLALAFATIPITLGRTNNEGPLSGRCSVTRDRSPDIHGFRLGTSLDQVSARFPGLITEAAGLSAIDLVFVADTPGSLNSKDIIPSGNNFTAYINRSKFAGFDDVDSLHLAFLDGSLTLIKAKYNDTTKWDSTYEFVERVSVKWGVPSMWQPVLDVSDRSEDKRVLECVGFRATASVKPKCTLIAFCGPGPAESHVTLSLEATAVAQTREQLQKQKKRSSTARGRKTQDL